MSCEVSENMISSDNAIEVLKLSKAYKIYDNNKDRVKEILPFFKESYHRDFYAVNNVSFSIKKGEIVGIIGKNGSGKSTILKLITGVLTPTDGVVNVNGKISALLELGTGFNPEMTGIENIYLNGSIVGFSKREIDKKVSDILDFADIGDFIYQPVKSYSSGMFVRLAFAVAINIQPDILIVDEALAVGDMQFQMKCMSYMKRLFESGATVLLVSHDLASIKSLCTRAIYMDKGKVIKDGPSGDVVNFYSQICREEMSKLDGESDRPIFFIDKIKKSQSGFYIDNTFDERVKNFRQGNGEARICNIEVLDTNGLNITVAEFNQLVEIRIHIMVNRDTVFGVGYHIRDDKSIEILGSNTVLEGVGEIKCNKGDCFTIGFKTRLPLIQGNYSIIAVLSHETIKNKAAKFLDLVENAYGFSVLENAECRIWNKVYIKNDIIVRR